MLILTGKGKTPLSFEKPKVQGVTPEPSVLDDYVAREAVTSMTAEAQYQLGLWCDEQKLPGLAQLHYEAAAQDKSFAPAHQKLGHVLQGERWLTQDEFRERKDSSATRDDGSRRRERSRPRNSRRRPPSDRAWRGGSRNCGDHRHRGGRPQNCAENELLQLRDPTAVRPLFRVLAEDEEPWFRMLLDRDPRRDRRPRGRVGADQSPVDEDNAEVRPATLTQLERPPSQTSSRCLSRLRSSNPVIVNRAAWVLSRRNVVSAVPKLIGPLHDRVSLRHPRDGRRRWWLRNGLRFRHAPGGAELEYVLSRGVPSRGGTARWGYGLTALPFRVGGVALRPSGSPADPKLIPITYQNVEARAALVRLTGQDFGYDTDVWRTGSARHSTRPRAGPKSHNREPPRQSGREST